MLILLAAYKKEISKTEYLSDMKYDVRNVVFVNYVTEMYV